MRLTFSQYLTTLKEYLFIQLLSIQKDLNPAYLD